ncbi:MAG: Rpn family recombination-promoting nuclease/putative transposase [Cyanobacteria bacterium J06607_13]
MYDNICKLLVEQFPTDFAAWLLGESVPLVELSPTELSLEPIRADSILLQSASTILHLEFQTRPDSSIPFRMLDYCLRIYRRFPHRPLRQIVIYLKPSQSPEVFRDTFELPNTRHRFEVIRLWEQSPSAFFSSPGLLPLAVLTDAPDRTTVLREVAGRIEQIENVDVQKNLTASTDILAGLLLEKAIVRQILRTELMQDSATYQAIIEEGRQKGRQEGRQEGAHFIVLQMLSLKLGDLPEELSARVKQLPTAEIPALGLALNEFESGDDLARWLAFRTADEG